MIIFINRLIQWLLPFICAVGIAQSVQRKPNIVLIYIDDLGYGDLSINGAIGVETPNIDALARGGINFSDAHSPAATCTPSRYSLLTGEYAFRRKAAILEGDAPLIIDTDKETLPKMLKKAGYTTGVIGKWHLGLGTGDVNWNDRVAPGPAEVGFDYSFLIPATGDRVPTVFLENQRVYNLQKDDPIYISYDAIIEEGYPIGKDHPELLKQFTDSYHLGAVTNGISRIGYMKGGTQALWIDEKLPFVLHDKATDFITKNKKTPFFLYYSFHDIHQPRLPNQKFIESSEMGPRGDVIAQMDWFVGQLINQLEEEGLIENTLLIFTSDNGPILDDGYVDYARALVGKHKPAGIYSGSKYSVYEGGTRVPTIIYWKDKIKPANSEALLSQVDLYASLAELVGCELDLNEARDSQQLLNAWLGKTDEGRTVLLEEAYTYGLRKGKWKYIKPKLNATIPKWIADKYVDPGFNSGPQLFNLITDPEEKNNISEKNPDLVNQLESELQEILDSN